MKQALAPRSASLGDIGQHSRGLFHQLERVLQRVLHPEPRVNPEVDVGGLINGPTTLLTRFDFCKSLIAIFSPDGREAQQIKSDIEDAGGTAMLIPQFDLPDAWLREYAAQLTCCIVGHDFEDADAAIDFCLRLRLVAPELVIVLTLENIKTHDFSSTRMPICDVTLRRPVSRVPLFLGLQAACDNRAAHDYNQRAIA